MADVLVIYDVVDDRARAKVADVCLDHGLARIQRSAFAGVLAARHHDALLRKLARALGPGPGDVRLYVLCQRDAAAVRVLTAPGRRPAPPQDGAPSPTPTQRASSAASTATAPGAPGVSAGSGQPKPAYSARRFST